MKNGMFQGAFLLAVTALASLLCVAQLLIQIVFECQGPPDIGEGFGGSAPFPV